MSILKEPLTEKEVKKMGVSYLRKNYVEVAEDYNRVLNGDVLRCPICGKFRHEKYGFYMDKRFFMNRFPICKHCLLAMVQQQTNKAMKPNETKESVQRVLRMMDIAYIDSFYNKCVKSTLDNTGENSKNSPFLVYITSMKALPQYQNKHWEDSEFPEDDTVIEDDQKNRKVRKEIRRLFGSGFTESDYLFLQDQYDDWKSRTQIDTKSQETYMIRICCKLLDIWKAEKAGKDTEKLDKSLNELMNAANLQPKQNVNNASTDNLTFGQLIEKWENEKPISEPAPEFKDVDGIGKYLRVFFAGHLAKALGLKNAYSTEYDEAIKQYTVTKPQATEESNSEEIYNKLFGSNEG